MVMERSAFAFRPDGTPAECRAFGHGHINHTLKITTDTGAEYILRRIHTYVCKIRYADGDRSFKTAHPGHK